MTGFSPSPLSPERLAEIDAYCPACSGHGTNVHECEEGTTVTVLAVDLREAIGALESLPNVDAYAGAIERLNAALGETL